jgi:hypothetical protein
MSWHDTYSGNNFAFWRALTRSYSVELQWAARLDFAMFFQPSAAKGGQVYSGLEI